MIIDLNDQGKHFVKSYLSVNTEENGTNDGNNTVTRNIYTTPATNF